MPRLLALATVLAAALAAALPASPARAETPIVVDNATPGRFDAAASWGTSRWHRSGFGDDYRFARPTHRTDQALFRVRIPTAGRYRVSAWWPADRGYSASTPFRILTRDGPRLVQVDQRRDGGRWVDLGTFVFGVGDDWIVAVSARTGGTGYVIADAVRFELVAPSFEGAGATLALGSTGEDVATLQRRLVELRYLPAGTADGTYGMRTWHAVVAFQGWRGLQRDGVAGPRTRASLATSRRPEPWGGLERGLEVDLRRQVLLVISGGTAVRAIHVSTAARGYETPTGSFRVLRRELRSWSFQYRVWLPYALYFSGGHALHAYPSVPTFPASHGCVRIPAADAAAVYATAPLGTPVLVR